MTTAAVPLVHILLLFGSVGGNGWPGVGDVICEQSAGAKPPLRTQSLLALSVVVVLAPMPTPSPYANQAPITPDVMSWTKPVEVDGSGIVPLPLPESLLLELLLLLQAAPASVRAPARLVIKTVVSLFMLGLVCVGSGGSVRGSFNTVARENSRPLGNKVGVVSSPTFVASRPSRRRPRGAPGAASRRCPFSFPLV